MKGTLTLNGTATALEWTFAVPGQLIAAGRNPPGPGAAVQAMLVRVALTDGRDLRERIVSILTKMRPAAR